MKAVLTLFGLVFILLGAAALIRPQVKMPAKESEIAIGNQKVKLQTQRIIEIPRAMSGLVIVAGCALVFLGTRKS
jgi:hypothetical protein